jgi:hypothetical protein
LFGSNAARNRRLDRLKDRPGRLVPSGFAFRSLGRVKVWLESFSRGRLAGRRLEVSRTPCDVSFAPAGRRQDLVNEMDEVAVS